MNAQLFAVLLVAVIAAVSAVPVLNQQEEEVLIRQRRQGPQGFGAGGANGKVQGGGVGFQNPNGSGGSVSYGHANGYGHNVGVDAKVPVWSSKNRFGESTLNVGGGATQHFGGPGGNQNLDKRVGASFNHRW
ncbi:attacin-A-like [Anthonomus grandis grandis]|uniref:attacin-A-like n=1 Tax=Anthonomus grandis grandis TaxID=2921223 RepID=UPI002166B311|nr:attacin-A-like [Anthonomus grandis grandis]